MPDVTTTDPSVDGFASSALAHLRASQAAVADLFLAAGLEDPRPSEVGRALDLDKTLAWKLTRFVQDGSPAEAVRHMPGASGVEIVVKAAGVAGVPTDRIEALRAADERLRTFMREHAGDRRSFEAMLASDEPEAQDTFEDRRAHFRTSAVLWGVRARAQVLTLVLRPSETEEGMLDTVQIGGLIHLERLRADVPWLVRRLRVMDDTGKALGVDRREPLDPAGATEGGLALVPEFCSTPLPKLHQFRGKNGWIYDEIAPGEVGKRSAVTCISGEIYRSAVPHAWAPDNTRARYTLSVRTPVELVVFDLLIHKSVASFSRPNVSVLGLMEDRPAGLGDAEHASRLVAPEPATSLGDPPATRISRVGAASRFAETALERAGWGDLSEYRGYRAELEYPVAPCLVALTSEIAKP